ncbi:NAD(P)-binding protein [Gymnopus androsaceus JB14]|uniref:NAD(P)-binding protein n=1 Tax=Gymnopus androsaceus JB14 TaxID=1447944 RepID=A0A6A4HYN7_9AGAR|nr:NAD(P)-binding protein [Gymnopus androsaceus JB14]
MSGTGKTAIITGASSGIGRHTAIALLNEHWNVVVTARRLEALQETQNLSSNPGDCLCVAGEITDENFVKGLFSQTINKFGRLDLLFNNAGISSAQVPIDELSLETFQNVLNVNLVGPFICTREAVKQFKAQSPPGGRVINNGSLSAHVPRPFSYSYTTSKHALTGLTKCTSLDGRAHNIACTQIDIGNAATDMGGRHGTVGALQPDGRMIKEGVLDVKHVASTIVHIASLPPDVTVLEVNVM